MQKLYNVDVTSSVYEVNKFEVLYKHTVWILQYNHEDFIM
jgi:hypothetical protein